MFARQVAVVCALLVPACWADFPASRFQQGRDGQVARRDAAPAQDSAARRDTGQLPRDVGARQDAAQSRPDGAVSPPDGRVADSQVSVSDAGLAPCAPGAVVGCSADELSLVICGNLGDPNEQVGCADSRCHSGLLRCTACDPERYQSRCVFGGSTRGLQICTPNGLLEIVACDGPCQAGTCCRDADRDEQTNCAGDCNDGDPAVFRGQAQFFRSPDSRGSFDYNCDGVQEWRVQEIWSCDPQDPTWRWADVVPRCGETGRMHSGGKRIGGRCVPALSRSAEVNQCR